MAKTQDPKNIIKSTIENDGVEEWLINFFDDDYAYIEEDDVKEKCAQAKKILKETRNILHKHGYINYE